MKYTVHQAKTNLSRLLAEAARGKTPVAKLVAIVVAREERVPGRLAGQISYTPDAFAPLTEQELSDLGF